VQRAILGGKGHAWGRSVQSRQRLPAVAGGGQRGAAGWVGRGTGLGALDVECSCWHARAGEADGVEGAVGDLRGTSFARVGPTPSAGGAGGSGRSCWLTTTPERSPWPAGAREGLAAGYGPSLGTEGASTVAR
jgi:hypothetical protein